MILRHFNVTNFLSRVNRVKDNSSLRLVRSCNIYECLVNERASNINCTRPTIRVDIVQGRLIVKGRHVDVVTCRAMRFTPHSNRTRRDFRLLNNLGLLHFQGPSLPVVNGSFNHLTLRALYTDIGRVKVLLVNRFMNYVRVHLRVTTVTNVLHDVSRVYTTCTTAMMVRVSTTFLRKVMTINRYQGCRTLMTILESTGAVTNRNIRYFLGCKDLMWALNCTPVSLMTSHFVRGITSSVFSDKVKHKDIIRNFRNLTFIFRGIVNYSGNGARVRCIRKVLISLHNRLFTRVELRNVVTVGRRHMFTKDIFCTHRTDTIYTRVQIINSCSSTYILYDHLYYSLSSVV